MSTPLPLPFPSDQGNDVTTYTYNRANAHGANETRTTSVNHVNGAVTSLFTFSDGRGYATSFEVYGCEADNTSDYFRGGPHDGFLCGDYSHLHKFGQFVTPGIHHHGMQPYHYGGGHNNCYCNNCYGNNNMMMMMSGPSMVTGPVVSSSAPSTTSTIQGPTYSANAPGTPSAVTTAQAPVLAPLVPVPQPQPQAQAQSQVQYQQAQVPVPVQVAQMPVIPPMSAAPMPVAGPRQYGPITGYGVPTASQYYSTYPSGYVPAQPWAAAPGGVYGGYRGYW